MSTPTSPPVANGRARKSLEHQLDRPDAILDGLADALDGAVADAVREAVQAVVTELLTDPVVARRLAEAHRLTPPVPTPEPVATPTGPTWRERVRVRFRRPRAGVAAARDRVTAAVAGRLGAARGVLTTAVKLARADRRG